MAEALAIEGAKWVASTILTSLLKEGVSYLGIGISTQLQNLEETILPQFQLVIEAAERSSVHKAKLELWLRKLKDAVYEAEDVMDLYKYQLLKEKVSDLNTRPALKPFKRVARKVNAKLCIFSPQKLKLRSSLNKLEKIAAEAKTFRELLGMPIAIGDHTVAHGLTNGGQPYVTTSEPPSKVFGRDRERDEIIDKYLLDSSEASEPEPEKCYTVVAIVGIGGIGKTTLARQVYNDQRLEKKFDIKMWVCVSRRLDVVKCTTEMIESASKQKRPPSPPPPTRVSRDVLKSDLIDLIESKKVLLILDDVWYDNSRDEAEKWENFIAPLAKAGKRGSRILVTTRKRNLPQALHPRYSMMLQDLKEDDILSLFNHHAFYGANLNNSYLQTQLENIGRQFVQKLHGSPLAAKAVGYRLSERLEVNYWRETLEGDNLCDARGALLWSYQRLDGPLQRCFSYFSLFPKGTSYNSEEMIRMWIAEGFINSSNDSRRMEDIGRRYFDELVRGSFLELDKDGYNTKYYNMHDLFHDLAENISKEDCLRIEEDEHGEEIPQTIRHLYVSHENLREKSTSLEKLKNLRTLIIYVSDESSAIDYIFAAAIKKCKKLRVLRINGVTGIETLPKSIGDLKHLRYLDLGRNNKWVELPASLGKLYHLQLLSLPTNANLPRSLKNLINLRHFLGALTAVPYIGRLTSLQALANFNVKKEKGYDIGQLKNMNEIRGWLTISYLENVEGKDKAAEGNLNKKKHLESLCLKWDNYDDDDSELRRKLDLEVLGGLQPHHNLTDLNIIGYKSLGYPSWLSQEVCQLQNLGSLVFIDCTNLQVLPDMSILFPCCRTLVIRRLPNLKKFPLLPESLKILEINECPSLVFVSKEELQDQEGQEKSELILPSSLQEVNIRSCSITDRALSQSLRSLASLKCLELQRINAVTTLPSVEVLKHLTSLTRLQIFLCSQLKSLGDLYACSSLEILDIINVPSLELEILASGEGGGRGILPPSLRSLCIWECTTLKSFDIAGDLPNLNNLWLSGIPSLASLSTSCRTALTALRIYECPLLSSLPSNLPDSLEYLSLVSCSGIMSLPENLPKSVDILNLKNCPRISSLPNLPQSLKMILISGCPALQKRCRSPDGEEWPKIAHIPKRHIDTAEDIA